MKKIKILVEETDVIDRIDKFLAVNLNGFTRSQIQKLCDFSQVSVNQKLVSKGYLLSSGDEIEVIVLAENELKLQPEDITFIIHYKDDYLAVIEKPKGILTHPDSKVHSGTLVNGLLYKFGDNLSNLAGENRPGIVHRLDKDTSGLLVIAFDNETHRLLNEQMLNHEIVRKYMAVVHGTPQSLEGSITQSMERDPRNRTRMTVTQDGRNAETLYKVIGSSDKYSLVELTLLTGRTHQIRVHMMSIGNPVVGDAVYKTGYPLVKNLNGQCLHAYQIKLKHPQTGETIEITSDLPEYFQTFLESIEL